MSSVKRVEGNDKEFMEKALAGYQAERIEEEFGAAGDCADNPNTTSWYSSCFTGQPGKSLE